MEHGKGDPFAVIACEPPVFAQDDVLEIARRHYGLDGSLQPLVSERDQNFRLRCADGRQYVIKIANAAEDPQATDFQIQALLHLESWLAANDSPVRVPNIVRTRDGQVSVLAGAGGVEHVARIVTYVAGVPLGTSPRSAMLCRRIGECLAHLGRALRDFEHPASDHGLLWDMQRALEMRRILHHVKDEPLRGLVAGALDDFEARAVPGFAGLRSQVIHSDLNPENILVEQSDADAVAGVIDFGDMLHAPLIVDVAICASYLRATTGDPFCHIAEFLAGYHSVTRLTLAEIDLLPDLLRTRLAASIAILAWRESLRSADDLYLASVAAAESDAAAFLQILSAVPLDNARQTLRQVCASV